MVAQGRWGRGWILGLLACLAAGAVGTGRGLLRGADSTEAERSATGQGRTDPIAPSVPGPPTDVGRPTFLPVLDTGGQGLVCQSQVRVQNLGCGQAKALVLTWGPAGACPPQAAGPLAVACTGLLRPGASWLLDGAQMTALARSGVVYGFSANRLSELGVDLGFDDVAADVACALVQHSVLGSAENFRRFHKAYVEGLDFAGLNLGQASSGSGLLAVELLRDCPVAGGAGEQARTASYSGIVVAYPTWLPLTPDRAPGDEHSQHLPGIVAGVGGMESLIQVQNAGLTCASFELWLKARDDCLRPRLCELGRLAPGESLGIAAADCVGPGWEGAAWLRASEPLAVVVDQVAGAALASYSAPPLIDVTVVGLEEGDAGRIYAHPRRYRDEPVAYAPLALVDWRGWNTRLSIGNPSAQAPAKVRLSFLTGSGHAVAHLVDWICPRGSRSFELAAVAGLPSGWSGSVRIERLAEALDGGSQAGEPRRLTGQVLLRRSEDAAGQAVEQALAYPLVSEHGASPARRQLDLRLRNRPAQVAQAGDLLPGAARVAIPSLSRSGGGREDLVQLTVMNLVDRPGFTVFGTYLFDQNGLLDHVCDTVYSRQSVSIDLADWAFLAPGFRGSALVSASYWEHPAPDAQGRPAFNRVGLAALALKLPGGGWPGAQPGDRAVGEPGLPLAAEALDEPCGTSRPGAWPDCLP